MVLIYILKWNDKKLVLKVFISEELIIGEGTNSSGGGLLELGTYQRGKGISMEGGNRME